MRKFYFLLMAAITLSMSAFENASVSKVAEIANLASMPKVIRSVAQNKLAPVATATDYESETWVSLGAGKFVASAVAECYGSSTDPVDVEIFEAQGKTGLYKVVGVWADIISDGTLYVDATDPEFVVIEDQFTGIVDKVDGNTHIASLSAVLLEKGYTKAQILALDGFEELNITLSDKVITIPEGSLALRWPEAPADSKYGTNPEKWYSYGENDGVVVLPGGEYVDPWGEAVDATMVETILGPTFGKTNTAPFAIQIQKNSETGAYRLISPWRQLYADLGYGSTAPNLEIDASDPTNLIIPLQATGLGSQTDGSFGYMSMSYYDLVNEQETDDALKITLTDNGDGTSTISFPYHSGIIYAQASEGKYYASGDENVLSYVTFPTFSGINDVKADIDNSNAPVEYFNLQGVRIVNPEAGQFVIKRQGSEVTKLIVR